MKLREVLSFIEAEPLTLPDPILMDRDIQFVSATDLMSDALAMIVTPAGQTILVTGLANGSALRTAEMMDIQNVVYCRNKKLSEDNLELAHSMGINAFTSPLPMFDVIGILYREGLKTATRQAYDS